MGECKMWLSVPVHGDCRVIPVLLRFASFKEAVEFKERNIYLELGEPFAFDNEGNIIRN